MRSHRSQFFIGNALIAVDQTLRLLDSTLFIGFVVKHPFHHPFAVIFQGDNAEAHKKHQRDGDENSSANFADFEIPERQCE